MGLVSKMAPLFIALIVALPFDSTAEEDRKNLESLVHENAAFATDLYQKLGASQGNIFFSPYSITSALAMTYAGARGTTEKQMAKVLRFPLDQKYLHPEFGLLNSSLNQLQGKGSIRLDIANSIWPQKGYNLVPEYVDLLKRYYGISVTSLDYRGNPENARETINRWIAKKTWDKIKDIIMPGMLKATTRLVLTNAIYFKGNWEKPFDPKMTRDRPFFLSPDKSVLTLMMTQTSQFRYAEVESMQVLELPYIGNELSMVVLLPREIDGIKLIEQKLSLKNLELWKSRMAKTKVIVQVPRFEMKFASELSDILISMGMVDAFSIKLANFSGIAGSLEQPLYLSKVIHKAFVEVGEEGTEAAAATVVIAGPGGRPREQSPPTFCANHPFMFLIQENQSGSILFMGRVVTPTVAIKSKTGLNSPSSRTDRKP